MPPSRPSARRVLKNRAIVGRLVQPERRRDRASCATRRRASTSQPIGDDRHAARLQHFQRLFDVEDRLGAGRDDDHRRARQFVEIGRNVEALFRALVHAADAAGGEHLDAGQTARRSSWPRPSCRRCVPAATAKARSARDSFIAPRSCASASRSPSRQADLEAAVDHGDRRRHRAFVGDDPLDVGGHGGVVGIGHAMRDDGAFQRHHRPAGGQRLGDRRGDVDEGAGGVWRSWSGSPAFAAAHATVRGCGTRASASAKCRLGDRRHRRGAFERQQRGGDAFAQRLRERQAAHAAPRPSRRPAHRRRR